MSPLSLVVTASERVGVGQGGGGDQPLRLVLLRGGLAGEVTGRDRVGGHDHRGDAGVLHLGHDLGGLLLDGARVQRVRQAQSHLDSLLLQTRLHQIGQTLGLGTTTGFVHQGEGALIRLQGVTGVGGGLARQLLGDELDDVHLFLLGTGVESPHVRIALGEPFGASATTTDAERLTCRQLVGESVGECRSTDDRKRLIVLDDSLGVGARRHLVVGQTGALVRHVLDRASVELVVRLEVLDEALDGLGLLGVGLVHLHGRGDVVDDRVAVGTHVMDDGDLLGGHTGTGCSTVVTLEGRHARWREVIRNRERTAIHVAPRSPVDGVGDSALGGLVDRQRVLPIGRPRRLRRRHRIRRRLGSRGFGFVVRIPAARRQNHRRDDHDDRHDGPDRTPLLQRRRSSRSRPTTARWLHGYPPCPDRAIAALDVPRYDSMTVGCASTPAGGPSVITRP